MPASPADIDVFELRKLQQYMREYIIFIVKMGGMKFGLKNMYNLYNSNEVAEYQHNVLALFFVFYFAKHFWNRY
jgi:hypothetical protein